MVSSKSQLDLTDLALERSKGAPLAMCLYMDEIRQRPDFARLIKDRTENTVFLWFWKLKTLDDLNQTLPTFPKSMAKLQALYLQCCETATCWDQSKDPFGSFPTTLKYLSLNRIPLYQSFLNLRTLTGLYLFNYQLDCSLSELLEILENNPLLKEVILYIKPMADPSLLEFQAPVSIKQSLELLEVIAKDAEVIKGLVSSIPLQLGATLAIKYLGSSTKFKKILEWVSATNPEILNSPNYMKFCNQNYVKLSGVNGGFSFTKMDHSVMSLVGFPSYENIQELYLKETSIEFDPLLFPALETLVIKDKENPSKVLSALFKSPQSSPSLKTLGFSHSNLTDDFMVELAHFASQYKGLSCVVIAHGDPKTCPSLDSIDALALHVCVDILDPGKKLSRGTK